MSRWRGAWKRIEFGEKYCLVIYERWGKKFEIVVDTEEAIKVKTGKGGSFEDAIVHPYVFTDLDKGILASTEDLRRMIFEVAVTKLEKKLGRELTREEKEKISEELERWDEDKLHEEAAKIVLEKGYIKLPESVRDRLLQEKIGEILRYLQKYAINPATQAPYPPAKLEEALKKVFAKGVKLDPLMSVRDLLPIIIRLSLIHI